MRLFASHRHLTFIQPVRAFFDTSSSLPSLRYLLQTEKSISSSNSAVATLHSTLASLTTEALARNRRRHTLLKMTRNPLDLPLPLVVDNLLPLLDNRDLASLRCVSKHAKSLVEDEVLWKRKVLTDFTFPPHASARMGGWFNLYTNLSNPSVYVWGQADNGRMGIDLQQLQGQVRKDVYRIGGIPYPVRLDTIGAERTRNMHGGRLGSGGEEEKVGAVVEIVAGGWSFHARTSTGRVWGWGMMDGEIRAGPHSPIRHPGKEVPIPQLMDALPPIQSLSGGRCHAVALTRDHRVLEWRAWGTVMEVQDLPESVTKPPPQSDLTSNITQLEAGWSFTAILTHTGEVWVWYSDWSADAFTRTYYRGNAHAARMMADPPGNEHLSIFPINVRPVQLPPFPASPQSDTQDTGAKIIQIAAGEDFLVALTESGTLHRIDLHLLGPTTAEDHLIVRRVLENRDDPDDRDRGALIHQALMTRFLSTRAAWEALPLFERPESLDGFDPAWLYAPGADGKSDVGRITHISAHFRRFVAFLPTLPPQSSEGEGGDTLVLLGSPSSNQPEMIPELQARGVIKVTMGDYHYGALTEKGEVLTWGSFSRGALGNWTPPWQDGAATTNTPPYDPGNAVQEDEGEQGGWSNIIPLPRIFRSPLRPAVQPRIGFAGRGGLRLGGRNAETIQGEGEGQSTANVSKPTQVSIRPRDKEDGTPFAFDLAFAGWHSSALVMQAPPSSGGVESGS